MGGKGALSSAIILARSSFDTWRVLIWSPRQTEEGLVVTRMGVRLPIVGLGATLLGGARIGGNDTLPADGPLSMERGGSSAVRDNVVSAKCLSPMEWLVSV